MNGTSLSTTVFAPHGFPKLPVDEALAQAAQAGFRQVELSRHHTDLDMAARVAETLGLTIWAVHGTLSGAHRSDDEQARKASVRSEVERLKASAAFAPCPYVVHYTNRVHDPRAGEAFRRSILELAEDADRLGITLAVETAPDKPSNERYPDSREITDFVRGLDHPSVRICIDLNHSNLQETLPDVAHNARGLIANIHVSDNHGVKEEHLLPGEGVIDFPAAFRAIAEAGYTGALNLELHTPGYPEREALESARRWAERRLREIPAG